MPTPIITLTTDFGMKDPYAAEMKAVILGICPEAVIVDITHEIEKFNLRMGAYVLTSAVPFFPKNTIHVAVVDPGVGSRRRPLLIQTQQGFFVGPDNGLMTLAAENQGIESVREIANPRVMSLRVSNTFHGRDLFAPAAAHLANGLRPEEFGPEIHYTSKPDFAKVKRSKSTLLGEVWHVDSFGNIITNINEKELAQINPKGTLKVELLAHTLKIPLCKAYVEARPKEPLALIGSHNYLEIGINQGSAAEKFKAKPGDKIKISNLKPGG